jgi:hypothetical protein
MCAWAYQVYFKQTRKRKTKEFFKESESGFLERLRVTKRNKRKVLKEKNIQRQNKSV